MTMNSTILLREKRENIGIARAERSTRRIRNQLKYYRPYPKQKEFHREGAIHRERLFMAGNQLGKTLAGSFEVAMHLTGIYPSWWAGRTFDQPTDWWTAGETCETTRDAPQRLLIGPPATESLWGTGSIPYASIINTSRATGISDALDTVVVKHISGGESTLGFKTYASGRKKWQAATLHGVWFDEEPPQDIYTEGLTRTNATDGIVMTTFTPMLGMSEVVRMFLTEEDTKEMLV